MLDELIVRNLGVLNLARLEPGSGFTVITGETGAGKTLLLGALRLLLGQAARSDLIGPFGDEAVVEGRFVSDAGEIGASRRLTAGGRSRAYIDGSVASAAALDEATEGLIEIVGQHDHLLLTRPAEVRRIVDNLLSSEGAAALAAYRQVWDTMTSLRRDSDQIGGDLQALERERDLLDFQTNEISSAGFTLGEDELLEAGLARLRNADALEGLFAATAEAIRKARDHVGGAVSDMRKAAQIDGTLGPVVGAVEALEAEAGEALAMVRGTLEGLPTDQSELEAMEERMRGLNDLRRKYGPSLSDVLAFGLAAERRASALVELLGRAGVIASELAEAHELLERAGVALRAHRGEAGARLSHQALGHLDELGLSSASLAVEVVAASPGRDGADEMTLLFASDSRLIPGDIAKVASGGELSRLVLALRLCGGSAGAATVVFDEIDTGVGGTTALAVGRKLAAVATERQVLCVTHLPQVAAFADTHYVVDRSSGEASVTRVEGEERLEELARMLAGLPDSEQGRGAAGELLALAQSAV